MHIDCVNEHVSQRAILEALFSRRKKTVYKNNRFKHQGDSMKFLIAATVAALLCGCVSSPSELYGIHQIPPEQAVKPRIPDDVNKPGSKG